MNTARKDNILHLPIPDNRITKSRSKKEILLDKLSKAIRLKHYSKATDRMYCAYVGEFIEFQMQKKSSVMSPLDRMMRSAGVAYL